MKGLLGSWRPYPADTLPWCFLLAVVRSKISPSPAASCATAALLDVTKDFVSPETIQRQLSRMMAGPIAFSFATAIDHQLAHAMCLE